MAERSSKAVIGKIASRFRGIACRILGIPYPLSPSVIYKSDFPSGEFIGKPSQIGAFSVIDFGAKVEIGENVKIGYGVIILSVSTITGSKGKEIIRKPVTIGNNVEIGSNTVILPGVTIGNNSTIGAGAVVLKDIPPNSIAGGVPARVMGKRE